MNNLVKGQLDKIRGKEMVKGGEIVARILAEEGVEHVFGIIDGTYFGFYSTLGMNGIELITPRHETSAVHMAGAYARVSGRLGVCMASNGPGVANALPGVAVEEAEGNRVLLITSARREGIAYPDRGGTFQFFPAVKVIGAMAKRAIRVPSADRVAELTRAALRACFTGRPGVVNLEIPENIMNGSYEVEPGWFRDPGTMRVERPLLPHPDQVEEAARMLFEAKRPLIHVGSGVVHASAFEEVKALAHRLEAALCTSWGARAALDERDTHVVAMPFVDAVNQARNDADVVLVLGSRMGETDWWGKAPYWASPTKQRLIQVDIDGAMIGCNRPVDLGVQADVKLFVEALLEELPARPSKAAEAARLEWIKGLGEKVKSRRKKLDKQLAKKGAPIHPAQVPVICQEVFDEDAFLVLDGGNTVIWGNFFHEIRVPGTVVSTPKMGMLGAGCAQPLGIQAAYPERQVYCITGDGSMAFHFQEVETAVRNEMPIIWVVMVDGQWGMVKMNQQFALKPVKTLLMKSLGPEETINADLGEIEFDVVAQAMGAYGERVNHAEDLRGALGRAMASGKAAVIHVDVDPVAHMWAPNLKTFKDMHDEPAG